jgi:MoaA/NifB/PqqE/SkfB family radical SAM enzyme
VLINVKNPKHFLWNQEHITGIHAEFTDKCNSGCPMCPRYINNGAELNPNLPKTEVSLEQFMSWFDEKFVSKLKRLYACGNYGDPIAARDTLEIYQYLRKCNPNMALAMHTNGSARSTDWWYELGKTMNKSVYGDYCTFSIDGLEDTNHLYRRNTNFKKIMENVSAFIDGGGIAHWDFIVFDYNEHQVEEAKKIAQKMKFENFNVKRTTRWESFENGLGYYNVKNKDGKIDYVLKQPKNSNLRDETYKVLRENLLKPNYITEQEFDQLYHGDQMFNYKTPDGEKVSFKHNSIEIACRAVKGTANSLNEIFLSADGHVFPCCFLGGEPWRYDAYSKSTNDSIMKMIELNGGMPSISLKQNNINDILNSAIYSEMLARSFGLDHPMRSRQCSTCCGKSWNKLDHGEIGNKNTSYIDKSKNSESLRK